MINSKYIDSLNSTSALLAQKYHLILNQFLEHFSVLTKLKKNFFCKLAGIFLNHKI